MLFVHAKHHYRRSIDLTLPIFSLATSSVNQKSELFLARILFSIGKARFCKYGSKILYTWKYKQFQQSRFLYFLKDYPCCISLSAKNKMTRRISGEWLVYEFKVDFHVFSGHVSRVSCTQDLLGHL